MRYFLIMLAFLVSLSSMNALARDSALFLSLADAMSRPDYKERLNAGVKFYFGKSTYPKPVSKKGEFVTNKKTNAFGKSDQRACEWVLLSALLSLQDRALAEGGNAVVDIVSYYKKNQFSSKDEYECHAGSVMAGVALKGRVVKLP